MEARGSGPGSRCYVLEVPPLLNLPSAHPMDFGQQQQQPGDQNVQGLIGFMVPSHDESSHLLPYDQGHVAMPSSMNPNSKNWSNEEVGTSDPKAGNNNIDQNISSGRSDGGSSWLKGSAAAGTIEKSGKMKARRRMREPRFCFQTRSDVDVLDDGYKWRKYGQKIVKNSLHPSRE